MFSLIKNVTTLQPITELRGLHVSLKSTTLLVLLIYCAYVHELMNLQILFKKHA